MKISHLSSRVPDRGGIVWGVMRKIRLHSIFLVIGDGEVIAESTPGVDLLHTGHLGIEYCCIRFNHRSANRCDIWTSSREGGVEDLPTNGLRTWRIVEIAIQHQVCRALTVRVQTCAAVSLYTNISGAIQKGDSHETELRILGALSLCIKRSEISLIV